MGVLPLICVLIAAAALALGEGEREMVRDLTALDLAGRERAYADVVQQRDRTVADLLLTADLDAEAARRKGASLQEYSALVDGKNLAMDALGAYRASEAVDCLLRQLTYQTPRSISVDGYKEYERNFPAAAALSEIGMPAVGPALEKLADAPGPVEWRLCAWIVKDVLGSDLALAALRMHADTEADPTRKARLEAGIEFIAKPDWHTLQ